jgi:predicted RNA-binding protein associated with RNAse of E/G family
MRSRLVLARGAFMVDADPQSDESAIAQPGASLTVSLVQGETPFLVYRATVLFDDGRHIIVRARWAEEAERDVGYVRFEQGDEWTEHYWRDRWYAVKEVRNASGGLKGWYCDVTRPAVVEGDRLRSEDLYLDLWVSGDGGTVLRLDEDEFLESGLTQRDPVAAAEARRALDELDRLGRDGFRETTWSTPDVG